jgi:uncharacterized protein YlxW (UPF0749 family)
MANDSRSPSPRRIETAELQNLQQKIAEANTELQDTMEKTGKMKASVREWWKVMRTKFNEKETELQDLNMTVCLRGMHLASLSIKYEKAKLITKD